MANLWADTPDYYGTTQIPLIWTNITAMVVSSNNGRRTSTNALAFNALPSDVSKTLAPGDATIGVAFGIKFTTAATARRNFFMIGDATVVHLTMSQQLDGTILWRLGGSLLTDNGTTIGATTWAPSIGVYYHFSILATINNTTGALSFKVNGSEQLNGGSGYTNIDTQNGGTAGWTRFGFARDGATPNQYICDFVVNDGTSAVNNGHPGDCAVLVNIPNAVNGGNTGFTPNGGTFHGDRVREIPLDDDTTYNASTASGQRDTYVFPSLALASGTIKSVINRMALKLSEAGAATAVGVMRDISGATNYDSTVVHSPSDASYTYFDDLREQDPATSSAWTVAGVNDTELGVKRAA